MKINILHALHRKNGSLNKQIKRHILQDDRNRRGQDNRKAMTFQEAFCIL